MTEYTDPTAEVAAPAPAPTTRPATAPAATDPVTAPAATVPAATVPAAAAPTPSATPAPSDAAPATAGLPFGQPLPPPHENVARGLLVALAAVLVAGVLAVVVWNLGFIASITSAVLAIGASLGYAKAAGAPPRRGIAPLVVLIVLGVVGTALAFVGWDASQYYTEHAAEAAAAGVSRGSFIWENITDGEVLSGYGGDLAMYFVFAALGTFGVLRSLLRTPA
ncbi:hypothetical protein G7075_19515 [Phycicoccus sp. HDW14]|uniref:hypothetical protein n=1 Tax=Phycicoccus sp. HDW14 TaxID=2714941 RepID=UPI00140E82E8|nr:hypothetical protein [Phycicoccus sp. HDW14]QIM22813.1 hypothetical protein G7075_19515 [Phycicoccus sp. HDW14]